MDFARIVWFKTGEIIGAICRRAEKHLVNRRKSGEIRLLRGSNKKVLKN